MPLKPKAKSDTAKEPTFISHLVEMRNRILRVVAVIVVLFIVVFLFFWQDILRFLVAMMVESLPLGQVRTQLESQMDGKLLQALGPAAPFFASARISLVTAITVAMPYILYELWSFVAPGLYRHERKRIVPLIVSSVVLFYAGMAFARYVVLPVFFAFIIGYAPDLFEYKPDIDKFLDFLLQIFFAFGIAFEIPIATIILVWTGVTTPESLAAKRRYIIVGVFILAMFLTPPDVFSQIVLAIPMWMLFELGLLLSKFYQPKPNTDEASDTDPESNPEPDGSPGSAPSPLPLLGGLDSSGATATTDDDYQPKTAEEMDAELDRFEREMDALEREQALEKKPSVESPAAPDTPPQDNQVSKDSKDP